MLNSRRQGRGHARLSRALRAGLLAAAASLALLALPGTAWAQTSVDACGTLSQGGRTYTLSRDISASGTCITITGNDIVFDLGGRTISFGSGNGSGVYGILNSGDRNTVRNGTVTQTGSPTADQNSQTAVRWATDTGTLSNVTVNVKGHDSFGITVIGYAEPCANTGTVTIDGNTVNHTGRSVSSRDNFTAAPIRLERPNGRVNLTNNRIIGAPQAGIVWLDIDWDYLDRPGRRGCGDGSEIANNEIRIDNAIYQNNAGFHCYQCPALQIHHNRIIGQGQEGIQLDNAFNQNGTTLTRVYSNEINVDGNYASAGHSAGVGDTQGIRIRYRPEYIDVYDNTITVNADDAGGSEQNNAWGIWVSADDGGAGKNVRIFNNTVRAITDGSQNVVAEALHVDCVTKTAVAGMEIYGNTFESNHRVLAAGYNCGWTLGTDKFDVRDNTFVKSSGTTYDFQTQFIYYAGTSATIAQHRDTEYQGGASKTDWDFQSDSGADVGIELLWTLAARANDANGAPVKDATIEARDTRGSLVDSCVTNCDGVCDLIVKEVTDKRSGTTNYNPYTVRASKSGRSSEISKTVNAKGLDATVGIAGLIDPSPCQGGGGGEPPPTVPNLRRSDVKN